MILDQRFCFFAIAFFVTTIVVKVSSGLIVPPRPSTNDDFTKKLNQISASDQLQETGSFIDSKAHGRYQRDVSNQARLQIYEADVETQTISVRLTPLNLVIDGVDSYLVQIVNYERVMHYQGRFAATEDLHCKLWDDALCFENLSVASISGLDVVGSRIKVSGKKNGLKVAGKQWECNLQLDLLQKDPSSPVNLTITQPIPGIVKFQWKHPWFPYTKLQRFQIRLTKGNTSQMEHQKVVKVIVVDHSGVPEKKEYEKKIPLRPSSSYHVEVLAENLHGFGTSAKDDFTTSSIID